MILNCRACSNITSKILKVYFTGFLVITVIITVLMYTIRQRKPADFLNLISKYLTITMSKCTIAVCQMTSNNDKKHNLEIVRRLVAGAAQKNAKMVFLPEACDYLCTNMEDAKTFAETLDGPLMNEYSALAKKFNVWLSIGGFHEIVKENNEVKLNNCHVILNGNGGIVSIYKKLHLFDVSIPDRNINLKESDCVKAGTEIVLPIETPAGPLGLQICYDLRFPELSTLQRKRGAAILTFPSAFTNLTGIAHWEILLRSRAIENQCYVIAAAQYGVHNPKRISYGQSMVVDPWGNILGQCIKYTEDIPTNESLVTVDIDLSSLIKIRSEMPVFEHRRNDIYRLIEMASEKISPDMQDTYLFADKIIKARTVFLCTSYSYAFTNIRCVVPGHVLVSSRRVARRLADLTQEEVSDLFQCVVKVQQVLEKVHGSGSSTICVQDGIDAGQTVSHVHVHILPRKKGDFKENDDIYQELAKHDRESNTSIRPIEEMVREATLLRSYFYF